MTPLKNNKAIVNLDDDDDEVHFKGVWKLHTAEIRPPDERRNIWVGSFNTAEEAARAYDTTTRDFLCKINHNNHILSNQSRNIASSSRSSSGAVSFPLFNQNPNEFRRFKTVTGTCVVMSMTYDKNLLESLMKAGVILPDPKMNSQKETLDFMGVGPVLTRTTSVEPLNLELSLAPPESM